MFTYLKSHIHRIFSYSFSSLSALAALVDASREAGHDQSGGGGVGGQGAGAGGGQPVQQKLALSVIIKPYT